MMRGAALVVLFAAACDPVWGVNVELRDPGDRPISDATVALACDDNTQYTGHGFAVRTDARGEARLGGIGGALPIGCDLYIAKPGMQPLRIRYRELCPDLDAGCDRFFEFSLVAAPCSSQTWGAPHTPQKCLAYRRL